MYRSAQTCIFSKNARRGSHSLHVNEFHLASHISMRARALREFQDARSAHGLRRHQFHAPIQRAASVRGIRTDRGEQSDTSGA